MPRSKLTINFFTISPDIHRPSAIQTENAKVQDQMKTELLSVPQILSHRSFYFEKTQALLFTSRNEWEEIPQNKELPT